MPADLKLHEFGSVIWDVFGDCPFHVGSSLEKKTGWRDVDVRLIIDDEEWDKQFGVVPTHPHYSEKWRGLVKAFSLLGREMTGLPIDFQIQQRSHANKVYEGQRAFLGDVPHRIDKSQFKE